MCGYQSGGCLASSCGGSSKLGVQLVNYVCDGVILSQSSSGCCNL